MIADAYAVRDDGRRGALIDVARAVTLTPWDVPRPAVLTDEDLVHAVALSAFFGHLNRIADVVGQPLDYDVLLPVPPVDPTVPMLATAPRVVTSPLVLSLDARPATATAMAAWRTHAFAKPHAEELARWAAGWLGAGNPVDGSGPLYDLAQKVVLAPWQLSDFATLRAQGYDDAAIFDAAATVSAAGMFSRIDVALRSLRG